MAQAEVLISVSTLLTLYANSLSSTLDGQIIILEGFYSNNNGKLYGKHYYDEIVSKDKQNRITVQITPTNKSKLETGSYYNFQGHITRGQSLDNNSKLSIYFRITKILEHKKDVQIVTKVEYDIIRARFDRDFPIIQDILLKKIEQGQKPNLDVLTGVQSTSKDEYSNQLHEKEYYNIRHHKCNLSNKNEILEFLNTYNLKDSDLLIILRGGGSGLQVFDDVELCKKAIELPIPFVTGIGHYEDKTLLQRVSDNGLATPTAVGAFLQNIINSHKERLKLVAKVEDEKTLLRNQINLQRKSLKLVWGIIFLLIIVIGYLIVKSK